MQQACSSQELDAKSAWYTDGSKQVHVDGVNVIGAGVYNAMEISHSINLRWSGATHTITRAELAAIASALLLMSQGQDEIIATDSQASICMIAIFWTVLQPAAMRAQGHAGGHSSPTSCPRKKWPADQNSESEVPYLRQQGGGRIVSHSRHRS